MFYVYRIKKRQINTTILLPSFYIVSINPCFALTDLAVVPDLTLCCYICRTLAKQLFSLAFLFYELKFGKTDLLFLFL